MSYFVLSIDGGGIRGILAASIIEKIEDETSFLKHVDLFAGTSTGGIIALGLASGLPPTDLVHLYQTKGNIIFSSRDLIDRITGPIDESARANYSGNELLEVLTNTFGTERTLGDLKPKRVLISTFELDKHNPQSNHRSWKPKFLHNYDGEGNDQSVRVIDAAMRTSAAPTYFPSYQGAIDGGIVANNPATCALAKVAKEDIPLDEIRILSIGTGYNPRFIEGDRKDWGYAQWAKHLLPILMDGMANVPHYQCKNLLSDGNYHRCSPELDNVIDLDAHERIDDLLNIANQFSIEQTTTWLRTILTDES